MDLTYQTSKLHEGETEEVWTDAALNGMRPPTWWRNISRAYGEERAHAAFEALCDSFTFDGSESVLPQCGGSAAED